MKHHTVKHRFGHTVVVRCICLIFSVVASSIALANPYKITVLATNISDYGGLGEWSFSAIHLCHNF